MISSLYLLHSHKLYSFKFKDLELLSCQKKTALNTSVWKCFCTELLVWRSELFETRSRCRFCKKHELYRRRIYVKRNGVLSYSCATIWLVGGYFMQRQRSYSSARVYTTEPVLPVLMWSCALAELSRKQTSMTSDEKRPRTERGRVLTLSNLSVQNRGDPSIRFGLHSLISWDDWPRFMHKSSESLQVGI